MLGLPAGKIHFDQQSQLYGFLTSLSGARDSPAKSLLPTTRDTQRLFSGALPTLHLFRKLVGIPNHVVLFLPRIGVYTIEQAVLITPEVIAGLRAAAVLLADANGEKRPVVFPGGGFTNPLLGEGRPQRRNQHPPPDAPGKGGCPAHGRLGQGLGEFLGVFDEIAAGLVGVVQ